MSTLKTLHETLHVGAHVRIVVSRHAGSHAEIIGYDRDALVAPWEVRPEGWPHELPGLMFEADELEVEA